MTSRELAQAPDYAEPLEAWRVWRVIDTPDGLALASIVRQCVWPAGEALVAECLVGRSLLDVLRRRARHPAPAPEQDCECGIYASSLRRLGAYLRDLYMDEIGRVIGRVALWGTVVECERGLRASHAYPLALYVPRDASRDPRIDADDLAEELRRYGVPVETLDGVRGESTALLERAA